MEPLIIGAGLAGLTLGRELRHLSPVILEKSRGVGGRLATRRMDPGTGGAEVRLDHGAQELQSASPALAGFWREHEANGSIWRTGRTWEGAPVYSGAPSMTSLPKAMSQGLEIQLGKRLKNLSQTPSNRTWIAECVESSPTIRCGQVLLTCPAPQILEILDRMSLENQALLVPAARERLRRIEYSPSIVLLSAHPPRVMRLEAEPSRELMDQPDEAILAKVRGTFSEAAWAQVHRWRYSQARVTEAAPFLQLDVDGTLWAAGDGFGDPSLPGAERSILSALALARHRS